MFKIVEIIYTLLALIIFLSPHIPVKSPLLLNDAERISLHREDTSCTETWFNLKMNNLTHPVRVEVYKYNFLSTSFNVYTSSHTIFSIENLTSKRNLYGVC